MYERAWKVTSKAMFVSFDNIQLTFSHHVCNMSLDEWWTTVSSNIMQLFISELLMHWYYQYLCLLIDSIFISFSSSTSSMHNAKHYCLLSRRMGTGYFVVPKGISCPNWLGRMSKRIILKIGEFSYLCQELLEYQLCSFTMALGWHVYGLLQRSDRKYDEAIKCYRNALKWEKVFSFCQGFILYWYVLYIIIHTCFKSMD